MIEMNERFYVAKGPHSWGKGLTVKAAKVACGVGSDRAQVVYRLPPNVCNVFVDDMGGVCWSWLNIEDYGTSVKCEVVWSSPAFRKRQKEAEQ